MLRVGRAVVAGVCLWSRAGRNSAQLLLLEADNPICPIPDAPRGLNIVLTASSVPPAVERVRLGRWLFFDKRLSKDATISCASCPQPEHAFSQTTSVATGSGGSADVTHIYG